MHFPIRNLHLFLTVGAEKCQSLFGTGANLLLLGLSGSRLALFQPHLKRVSLEEGAHASCGDWGYEEIYFGLMRWIVFVHRLTGKTLLRALKGKARSGFLYVAYGQQ